MAGISKAERERRAAEAGATPLEASTAASDPSLVVMVRDAEQYPPPHRAEVHPSEVDNWRAGGWATQD